MKKDTNKKRTAILTELCEREYYGKKLGLIIGIVVSAATVLLSLPVVKWIYIVNAEELYGNLGLKVETIHQLKSRYSLFHILSFVKETKAGNIGLFSMIVMLLLAAAMFFHIIFIVRALGKGKRSKGNLSLYFISKTSLVFTMLLFVATIIYTIFANSKFGVTGFMASPVVYLISILSVIAYISITLIEVQERRRCHEFGFWHELKKNWVLFVMLIPAAIYLMINNYLPMIGIYYAFTSFNFRDGLWASPYIGLKNFEYLFRADLFKLTKNTILYNFAFIVIGNTLQITFAIFVSQVSRKWFKRTTQTLMFMPYFVSYVILKVLVYNLFEYNTGVVNTMISSIGLDNIDFYNKPGYWPIFITLFYIWKNLGYGMVVYLATILGISDEYYEAAKVDGANIIQQIRYITLPLIKPTFIILFLFSLGSIMKGQFELFYQLIGTNGVLFDVTDIFDTYVYRITTTQPLSIGVGTAAGLYQSLFGFVLIMLTNYLVKRKNPEYALF